MTPLEATGYLSQLPPHQRLVAPTAGGRGLQLLKGGKSEPIECGPGMRPVVLPDGLVSEEADVTAGQRGEPFRAALEEFNERYAPALRRLAE